MADQFTFWFAEEKLDRPRKQAGVFNEPAEAADEAEKFLARHGFAGESYAEIRFNGDAEPHSVIFLMEGGKPPTFGIWNTPSAMWPIFYPESPYGVMLEGNPFRGDDEDDKGEHKKDEDSDKMKLDGMDDEDEGDEEDDEIDEDENEEEDDGADEEDDSDESDDDDADTDDEDDDDENKGEEGDDELEDENAEEDSDGENEQEAEMPRLNIFGKMRGPKGWRKRAEAEELNNRNVFGLKIGILDPEADKPGQQERNVLAHVEFIESDETRDHGILKLRLPEGVSLDDFTQTKAGVITVKVPYQEA